MANKTTREICSTVIEPETLASKAAFIDHVSQNGSGLTAGAAEAVGEQIEAPPVIGTASVFVSHSWSGSALDLLESVIDYAEENGKEDAYFWIDIFCFNQHHLENAADAAAAAAAAAVAANTATTKTTPDPAITAITSTSDDGLPMWLGSTFKDIITFMGTVLQVLPRWDAPLALIRSWCLWEAYCALDIDHGNFSAVPKCCFAAGSFTLKKLFGKRPLAAETGDNSSSAAAAAPAAAAAAAAAAAVADSEENNAQRDLSRLVLWLPYNKRDEFFSNVKDNMGFDRVCDMLDSCKAQDAAAAKLSDVKAIRMAIENALTLQGEYGQLEAAIRKRYEEELMRIASEHARQQEDNYALANLSECAVRLHLYEHAYLMLETQLNVMTRERGEDHPDSGPIVSRMAVVRCLQGKYEEARRLFRSALDIQKASSSKIKAAIHTGLATAIFARKIHVGDPDLGEAWDEYERALELRRSMTPEIYEMMLHGPEDMYKQMIKTFSKPRAKATGDDAIVAPKYKIVLLGEFSCFRCFL